MSAITLSGALAVRDFRMWWALFVFFGVLSVLAVQQSYRRWRQARAALAAEGGEGRRCRCGSSGAKAFGWRAWPRA